MIYEYDLVLPADTKEATPEPLVMQLTHGIIHRVEISFPSGCNGQVKVVIRRALHQVFPTNPDGQLKANGFTISGPVWYELEEAPYQLEAYGWSPDTSYDHTITIRLYIERREVLEPGAETVGIIGRLGALILGRK